jgi:diguanylate cyclase (GGDEF)-like protein
MTAAAPSSEAAAEAAVSGETGVTTADEPPADVLLSDVLSDFARTMLTDFPIQAILDHLVRRIVDILPIDAAGVTLISPLAGPHYVAASDPSALRYEELQTELGEGPCLAAYTTGEAVSLADLRTETRFKAFVPAALEAGLGAAFTFPLHHNNKRLGALDLYRTTPGALSGDDMVTSQTLADVTAAYLVNAQARADLTDSSEHFHDRSLHDGLTGLPNRALLLERLEHAALRSRRSENILALLFLDLDGFKTVNDAHGHSVGDSLLIAVARRLSALLRPADTLARLAGDEFVVLLEDLESEGQAELIAGRILDAMAAPFELSGVSVEASASVGIAFAGLGERIPDQLLRDADMAMYQVKRRGGANHQVIDLREQRLADHRTSLERDLREALAGRQLRAEYQPIVHATDGRVTGAEALLRWDHPAQGPIPPTTVIPIAEHAGLMSELGQWMLEKACADRHSWDGAQGNGAFNIAVNVSASQLMAAGFAAMVASVLTSTNTSPTLVTLEMTETIFIQDIDRALIVLHELKDLGLHLALDDFGTGYSSLSEFRRFPVDILKIDRSFTADMVQDAASRDIVSTVIDLAHRREIAVVTEGVETAAQHDLVRDLGGDFCQGYYFGRPMRVEELVALPIELVALPVL